jgi:hypothetical protein
VPGAVVPMVGAFEVEFAASTGIPPAVAVSSGTAAMHLMASHVEAGPARGRTAPFLLCRAKCGDSVQYLTAL